MAYGAKIIMVDANFDTALELVRSFTTKHEVTLVNSVNPFRLEGAEDGGIRNRGLRWRTRPTTCLFRWGNAGNITAYWRGFQEYHELGRSSTLPRMMGFQAEGAAPIVRGEPVANPQTIASAIRIGNPASWKGAIDARDSSGGTIDMVSDDEILEGYRLLASHEGIFCEPASAASFAGLIKMPPAGPGLFGQAGGLHIHGNWPEGSRPSRFERFAPDRRGRGDAGGSGSGGAVLATSKDAPGIRTEQETITVENSRIQQAVTDILDGIGEDSGREGLQQTPARVARMYQALFAGVGARVEDAIDAVFEAETDDPVAVSSLSFYSMCEHHLLPFFGEGPSGVPAEG